MNKTRVAMFGNPSGARVWRLAHPAKYLNKLKDFECVVFEDRGIDDEVMMWADIVVCHSLVDKNSIAMLRAYQAERGKKIVVDCDDFITIDPNSPFKEEHDKYDAGNMMRITMGFADLVTTSTQYLANKLSEVSKNVKVLPNYMDMESWDLETYKNTSDKVRLLYAGSITHMKDLEILQKPMEVLYEKFPDIQLVIVGDPRAKELFKNIDCEVALGVPVEYWPRKLHGIRFDIGLAPLADTEFTRCKSNIKILEYGICQAPVVVSDNGPYRNFGSESVFACKTEQEWIDDLSYLIKEKEDRRCWGRELYKKVRDEYDLSKHIGLWEDAYNGL